MNFDHWGIFGDIDISDWCLHDLFCKSEPKEESTIENEKTTIMCDVCDKEIEITNTYINKFGQLISIIKCPCCGYTEAICERGTGKEIERK